MALVEVHNEGAVRHIVLNRPEKRNALNREMMETLSEAIDVAAADPGTHVVVLSGEGPSFCAGVDRAFLGDLLNSDKGLLAVGQMIKLIQGMWNQLESMAKVTVAQINGPALGGGMEAALACDLRTMADDATAALIHAQLGFLPETGGCARLASVVGVGRAKELIMTGRPLGAEEAVRIGFANRIAPAEDLAATTAALVDQVRRSGPLGIAAAKRIIDTGAKPLLSMALEMEMAASLRLFGSEDAAEAARAFAEQRQPEFAGR